MPTNEDPGGADVGMISWRCVTMRGVRNEGGLSEFIFCSLSVHAVGGILQSSSNWSGSNQQESGTARVIGLSKLGNRRESPRM